MRLFKKGRGSVVKGSDAASGDQLAATVDGTCIPVAEGVPLAAPPAMDSNVEGSAQGLKPPLDTARAPSTTAAALAASAQHAQGQLVVPSSTEQYLQDSSTAVQLNVHCFMQSSAQLSKLQSSHAQPVQDSPRATQSSPAQHVQDTPAAAPLCSGPVAATACDTAAVVPAAADEHLLPSTAAAARAACNTAGAAADSLKAMQSGETPAAHAAAGVAEAVTAAGAGPTGHAAAGTLAAEAGGYLGQDSESSGQQRMTPPHQTQQAAELPAATPAVAGVSKRSPCLAEGQAAAVSTGAAADEPSLACRLQDITLETLTQGLQQPSLGQAAASTAVPEGSSACRLLDVQERPLSPTAERRQQAAEAIERLKRAMAASAQLLRSASVAGSSPSTPRATCSTSAVVQAGYDVPVEAAISAGKLLHSASAAGNQRSTPRATCSTGGEVQASAEAQSVLEKAASAQLLCSASATGGWTSTHKATGSAGGVAQADPGVLAAAPGNLLRSPAAEGSSASTSIVVGSTGVEAQEVSRVACYMREGPATAGLLDAAGSKASTEGCCMAQSGTASVPVAEQTAVVNWDALSETAVAAAVGAHASTGNLSRTDPPLPVEVSPMQGVSPASAYWYMKQTVSEDPAGMAVLHLPCSTGLESGQDAAVTAMGQAAEVAPAATPSKVSKDPAEVNMLQAPCNCVLRSAQCAPVTAMGAAAEPLLPVTPASSSLQVLEDPAEATVLQAPCSVLGSGLELAVTETGEAAVVNVETAAPAAAPACLEPSNAAVAAGQDLCDVQGASCGMQSGTGQSTQAAEMVTATPADEPAAVTAAPCLAQADAAAEQDMCAAQGAPGGSQSGTAHRPGAAAGVAITAPAAVPSAMTAVPCLNSSNVVAEQDACDAQVACMQSSAAHSAIKAHGVPAEVMSPGVSPPDSRRGSLRSSSALSTDLHSTQLLGAVHQITAEQAGSFAGLGGLEGHTEPASLNGSSNGSNAAAACACSVAGDTITGPCSMISSTSGTGGGSAAAGTAATSHSSATADCVHSVALKSSSSGSAGGSQAAGSDEVQRCFLSLGGAKQPSNSNSGTIKGRANGSSRIIINITADSSLQTVGNCSTSTQLASITELMHTAAVNNGSHAMTGNGAAPIGDSLVNAAVETTAAPALTQVTRSGSSSGDHNTAVRSTAAAATEAEAERAGRLQLQQLLLSKQLLQAAKTAALGVFDQDEFLQAVERVHDESRVLQVFEVSLQIGW